MHIYREQFPLLISTYIHIHVRTYMYVRTCMYIHVRAWLLTSDVSLYRSDVWLIELLLSIFEEAEATSVFVFLLFLTKAALGSIPSPSSEDLMETRT